MMRPSELLSMQTIDVEVKPYGPHRPVCTEGKHNKHKQADFSHRHAGQPDPWTIPSLRSPAPTLFRSRRNLQHVPDQGDITTRKQEGSNG